MSTNVTYPFASELHLHGSFGKVALPDVENAFSHTFSNVVPQSVDKEGRLHFAVYLNHAAVPVTDIVFKIPHDENKEWARLRVAQFLRELKKDVECSFGDHHLADRYLHGECDYFVIRTFFNRDFKCTHHPEFTLGKETKPYLCPVCGTMQISGVPHIEDTSE